MLKIFLIQFIVIVAEKNINFKVQHQCPQCGAPIILEEETLFFTCEYCRVKSCISQKGFARYAFSPHENIPEDQDILYLPYWRFKGIRFTCLLKGVDHKFIDISSIAMKKKVMQVPASLGFRSQALTLKRITTQTPGTFLRPWDFKKTLLHMDKQVAAGNNSFFQENIGETSSLIYSPFYNKDDTLFDAILNKPIGRFPHEIINTEPSRTCRPEKEILFTPGLCPSCGWDLEGNSDSLIMPCRNCETLWKPHGSKLARIKFSCPKPANNDDVMLPFWKINTDISMVDLKSYSDLIKLANLPRVPDKSSDNQDLSFWAPAFKIRPKIFLRLITQLAILQPEDNHGSKIGQHSLSSVNLPSSEAVETIRVTLGALLKPATQYLPILPEIKTTPTSIKLVYLPFESQAHDLYRPDLGVSINRNALKLSSNL